MFVMPSQVARLCPSTASTWISITPKVNDGIEYRAPVNTWPILPGTLNNQFFNGWFNWIPYQYMKTCFFLQTSKKKTVFFGRISGEWLRMLAMRLPEKEAIQILQDWHCLRDLLRKDHHALQHELSKHSQPLHFFEDQVWCGNCCN